MTRHTTLTPRIRPCIGSRIVAAALTAALAGTGAAGAVSITAAAARAQGDAARRIDTTFAFGKSGWLDLSAVSGTIVVTGWTRPEAHVVARIETGLIEATYSSARIALNTRGDRVRDRRGNRQSEAYFEVSVPIGTRVMANTTSGDVRVRGTAAEVQVRVISGRVEVVDAADFVEVGSVSGDIRLDRIRARTRISTTSGDLELDGITGDLEIRSTSSDMTIRRVESSNVRIGTTSGDISYEGTIDPKGTYEISSHSGRCGSRFRRAWAPRSRCRPTAATSKAPSR